MYSVRRFKSEMSPSNCTRCFWLRASVLVAEGFLYLLYVKVGKFHHRDFILDFHEWRGDEQVLDVGCGRGLLVVGAAKRLNGPGTTGHATGIDIWSNVDMGGNAIEATQHNIALEGLTGRCTLVSGAAQEMPFPRRLFRRHRVKSLSA